MHMFRWFSHFYMPQQPPGPVRRELCDSVHADTGIYSPAFFLFICLKPLPLPALEEERISVKNGKPLKNHNARRHVAMAAGNVVRIVRSC